MNIYYIHKPQLNMLIQDTSKNRIVLPWYVHSISIVCAINNSIPVEP